MNMLINVKRFYRKINAQHRVNVEKNDYDILIFLDIYDFFDDCRYPIFCK